MGIEPFHTKLIQLYKDQELLMASLYEKLANSFPAYGPQFMALAGEEREHAGWIDHLKHCIDNGSATFIEGKARTYTISSMIKYIQGIIDSVDRNAIDLTKAVSLVLDTEKSFIERQVFERFTGDSSEVNRILKILEDTQKEHLERIALFVQQVIKEQR
jgi:hypothetical protein